jgi:hypothetical protein
VLYTECYLAIERAQKKEQLKEKDPPLPEEYPETIKRNIKVMSARRHNDTLAQYFYLGLANQYLEDHKDMTPKEVRKLGNQTRSEYTIGRFMIGAFECPGHIAYLQNISATMIGNLSVQEERTIAYQLTRTFPWKPVDKKKRFLPEEEDDQHRKRHEKEPSADLSLDLSLDFDFLDDIIETL